jgi:hypothetical protein
MKMRDLIQIVETTTPVLPIVTIQNVNKTMRLIMLDGEKAGAFHYGSRDVMKGMGKWGKESSWTGSVTFNGEKLAIGATDGVSKMKDKVEATIRRYIAQQG